MLEVFVNDLRLPNIIMVLFYLFIQYYKFRMKMFDPSIVVSKCFERGPLSRRLILQI